jgi:RimJ/RimL family protein N-acetyltransferase
VVGAIDIKSSDLDAGEIGYWASSEYPGYVTNAVVALSQLAKNAGFKSLFADTVPDNLPSQSVLRRAGFNHQGLVDRKGKGVMYYSFVKEL